MNTGKHGLNTPAPRSDTAEAWLQAVAPNYAPAEAETIRRALDFAAQHCQDRKLPGGEPLMQHALESAAILTAMHMDSETVAAALLCGVPEADRDAARRLGEYFGAGIAGLVEGAARMGQMRPALSAAGMKPEEQGAQLEGLRKMLLAMVQDARVVLIKLADQTQTLRHLAGGDDEAARTTAARETLDIFAPLANRLGVWQIKWEMEDLAFRILEPGIYKKIASLLDEKRGGREQFIATVISALRDELHKSGIRAEVSGRPKHIYSIYRKMRRKDADFEEIYDVRAVRILVDDIKDCYAALGVVHNLWTPIPREFDDYIAKPKGNDYRSLHTAVIGPENKALEVQIRTHDMHQHSELGVAAHWRYKEGGRGDVKYGDKIAWLRQILAWKDEMADGAELARQFKTELFQDTIYVFTPQGKVIDLPRGATPVDFAYHVHSDLGHRCRGAKVDGVMVPLNHPLANGQRVEIVSAKQGGPSRDWLNPELGYLKSHRARAKVRQWFNTQNLEASIAQGRALVERELQRLGMTSFGLEKLAEALHYAGTEEMLAAAGKGEIGPRQIQGALGGKEKGEAPPELPAAKKTAAPAAGILLVGVDKLLTVLAKCCKPAPPDPIIGFVTRGRGVTVHRLSCPNVPHLDAERLIAADWGRESGARFPVDVEIEAGDRQGLLRDVSDIFSREKINVAAAQTQTRAGNARMAFTLEVNDLGQLQRVLALIQEVPGVIGASRRQ